MQMRIVGRQPFGSRDLQQAIICRNEDVFSFSVRLGSLSDNQVRNGAGQPQCFGRRREFHLRNARVGVSDVG
jgi:hypothetical protein